MANPFDQFDAAPPRNVFDQFDPAAQQGGVMQTADNAMRGIARGLPFGSYMDEIAAAADAATQPLLGRGAEGESVAERYNKNVAAERARDAEFDKANPKTSTALQLGGAILSAPLTPMIKLAQGATMLPKIANSALTGAVYGGAYGSGEGGTWLEGAKNAAVGTGLGAGIGSVAPVVARGVSNAAGYVADKFKGVPAELAGYVRPAIDRVGRAIRDDAIDQPSYARHAADLGPEGMLADMGPNLTSQAGAIANQPGAGQRTIVQAIDDRKIAAPGRVQADVDAALGPRINLVEAENTIRQRYGAAADPLYEQYRANPVPYTQELEGIATVLQAQPDVLRKARQFATLDGTSDPRQFFAQIGDDGSVAIQRVPNASEWDYVKRALDDYARNAGRGTNEERIYGNLARRVRDSIDAAISPNDPSQSVYAQARGVAGEGIGIRNAMEAGQGAFSKGLHPDQMRADLAGMTRPEQLGYVVGARGQVADIMGNSATAFGANGDTAARRALGSDYAREKLGMVAGDSAADSLIRRLDAETAFERTRQNVLQNSKTASRLQAQTEFPSSAVGNDTARELGQRSLTGIGLEGAYRLANALLGGALNERRSRIAADAGDIISATGPERDALARALLGYNQGKALTQQGKEAVERLASALIQGARPPAIDYLATK